MQTEKETHMYRTEFWTLWEKARVGCFERTASKHVYYLAFLKLIIHIVKNDSVSIHLSGFLLASLP